MVGSGSIPPYGQAHHLLRRTAKDLLRLRLANAKRNSNEDEVEIQHLEKQFCNQHIKVLLRHPAHGIVAESRIPIWPAEDDDFLSNVFQEMTMHGILRLSEYEECDIEWQMPGGLPILHFRNLVTGAIEPEADTSLNWWIAACSEDMHGRMSIGFIRDFFDGLYPHFLVTCEYAAFLSKRKGNDIEYTTLKTVMPESVLGFCSLEKPSWSSYRPTPLEYLKTLESWMTVALQLQDDATELTRLRSRFKETYLMVEMGLGWEIKGAENCGKRQDGNENDELRQEMDTMAFALVPLMDETGLMNLLNSQSTCLQFVEEGGRNERLLPLENQFARISILDLGNDRVYNLSESYFPLGMSGVGEQMGLYDFTATRRFFCFDREIQIFPSFEEKAVPSENGKDITYVVTVKLDVVTQCRHEEEDEDEDEDGELLDFTSVLELWKFLELSLMASQVGYAKSA